jgi:hypothetical protein
LSEGRRLCPPTAWAAASPGLKCTGFRPGSALVKLPFRR